MSTMEISVNLTQKIEADILTPNGDWQTQNGLNTETLTHKPVDEQTQFDMDPGVVPIQLKTEPPTQGGDCQAQTGLNTETLTYEPVEEHTQSDTVPTEDRTQKTEAEPPTPRGDAEIQTPEKASLIDAPTQSGDTEFQTQDRMEKQNHSNNLLQVVSAISRVSADTSPEVLAMILLERWQEKEAETQRLREDLMSTDEEKTTAQAQVKNLITAACSISEATEDSTPKDVAEKLLEARQVLDVRRSETTATWRERFRTMKNKMDLQIRTLADPIKLITDSMDAIQSPNVLAENLRQAWDQVQAQNDELELDLMTATDRVKQLESKLEAQAQDVKCLATDAGVCLAPDINLSDVVVELRWSFDDLQKEIAAKEEQIEDLLLKLKALTSSLEDLQPLLAAEPKKGKKRSKKLRLRWWKRAPEQQEESNSYLEKLQEGLIKQKTTMSLLEAKMTILADQMKKEKDCLERQKALRAELQNDVKLLQFDNQEKETLIQSLRDLVDTLQKNCLNKNRGAARFQARNAADHATVASMPTIKCEVLDINDILPFSGCHKPGDLSNMPVLGKETYGKVYLGRHGDDFRPIAIKQPVLHSDYRRDMLQEEKLLMNERATKESMVQQLLSGSPYFPKMLGVVTIGDDLCTVMDFIGNKKTGRTYPLYRALTRRFKSNPKLGLINMLQVCEDIIKGIMELHREGYLHNDLKSNNILLEKRSQRWHAIIIDLGLASAMAYAKQRRFSDKRRAEYRSGKIYTYMAPEVVLYGKRNSVASDIYSFGVILESIARKIKISEVAELAEDCTEQDPLKRPHSMEEILLKMEAISASYY
ncbi:dual serine/threonine and tyrosine protein kinase-like [Strongylocentrotus purpuratus]|uniref:Protein kinase domain-containing protein n=1 Tax=Strongylocentrotus purpuratus TaxID=7668 RepID=A0A7M7NE47_STRPU|nr:dual serine/threonine and tyrosine protein kinase-like [Strongylocentrotus purpuratus]